MYSKVDVESGDEDDVAKDPAGYNGEVNRFAHRVILETLTEEAFLNTFKEDNRISKIMLMIRSIDRDRNGYVTTTEMDDILKEVYPE